jgi:RimJ/RimL family protein N-acetyltransferase
LNGTEGGQAGFLIGERVYLRPLEREDAPHIQRWTNDPALRRLTGAVTPMTRAGAEAYVARVQGDESRIWFIVALRADGRVIGEVGLLRMFYPWRTTDLTIILGEEDARGAGYGTEAITLLLDYAFGQLGFHRVSIGVVGFNERALRFYERIGFRREGLQQDGYYDDYRYHDFVMLRLLADEFRGDRHHGPTTGGGTEGEPGSAAG